MKKFLYIFLTFFITSSAFANQPVDWQLGFQKAASETMRDIVNFHDKLLLPIIIGNSNLSWKLTISLIVSEAAF